MSHNVGVSQREEGHCPCQVQQSYYGNEETGQGKKSRNETRKLHYVMKLPCFIERYVCRTKAISMHCIIIC